MILSVKSVTKQYLKQKKMKNKVKVLVLGSGAGGLGAAAWLKEKGIDFMVVDGCKELPLNLHNGVHYLHTIPELPFKTDIKKITLTDAILNDGKMYDRPSLKFALKYSEKTGENQRPSSIMSVGKEDTAYMPSSNSLNTMLQEIYDYSGKENFQFGYWLKSIQTNEKVAWFENDNGMYRVDYEHIISTIPLDKMSKTLEDEWINSLKLECNSIFVANYKVERIVPNWMINVYIPDFNTPIYRASFLNGICSVESIKDLEEHDLHRIKDFLSMFHINMQGVEKYNWKTGKVISITPEDRNRLVEILKEKEIYQIGRFGLWNRKLLIDSTINQAKAVVEHLSGRDWSDIKSVLTK